MKPKRKSAVSAPKRIEGNGEHGSCYHLMEDFGGGVRLQVNARDALYLSSRREIRKIHAWLGKYLAWAEQKEKRRD